MSKLSRSPAYLLRSSHARWFSPGNRDGDRADDSDDPTACALANRVRAFRDAMELVTAHDPQPYRSGRTDDDKRACQGRARATPVDGRDGCDAAQTRAHQLGRGSERWASDTAERHGRGSSADRKHPCRSRGLAERRHRDGAGARRTRGPSTCRGTDEPACGQRLLSGRGPDPAPPGPTYTPRLESGQVSGADFDQDRRSSPQGNLTGLGIVAAYSVRFWSLVIGLGVFSGLAASAFVGLLRLVERLTYAVHRPTLL